MWRRRETGKAVWETRRPFSFLEMSIGGSERRHPNRTAARWMASPRRACAGAIFSFIIARISGQEGPERHKCYPSPPPQKSQSLGPTKPYLRIMVATAIGCFTFSELRKCKFGECRDATV